MKVTWINDWRWLFSKYALGGRFAVFTFFNVSYMDLGDEDFNELDIDGLSVIILGLGVRIRIKGVK